MKSKKTLSIITFVIVTILAIYVGVWLMFIVPIIDMCKAFDANTLTGLIIGKSILKMFFSSSIAGIIIYLSVFINYIIYNK